MSRSLTQSSRRLLTVAALVTATAVPSVLVVGSTAAGAQTRTTTPSTMVANGNKWR
jgi:hypothetical protein